MVNSGVVRPDLGEEESRAVRQFSCHVPAEAPPGEHANAAGICLFPGQRHYWQLPHSAVGEALAYIQEPVGKPQSPSPLAVFEVCPQYVLVVPLRAVTFLLC